LDRRFVLLTLLLPLVVAPLVYAVAGLTSGMGVAGTWNALVEQGRGRRNNPMLGGVLGLAPAVLLLLSLWLARRAGRGVHSLRSAGWGGLTALLLTLVWANWQVWSLFLPSRVYPGFPHGL
jgi:hypothetical protein